MSATSSVKVSSTQFGDIVYFTTSAGAESEELVWTSVFDYPKYSKLMPLSQVRDPLFTLFQILPLRCSQYSTADKKGDVLKPGQGFWLSQVLSQRLIEVERGKIAGRLSHVGGGEMRVSVEVCADRGEIEKGVKDGDVVKIKGLFEHDELVLGADFWLKGVADDTWVVHLFEPYSQDITDVRCCRAYKLRASNSMFLSVQPDFSYSEPLVLPEDQQSSACLSDPELYLPPEYCGPLRADLTTDEDDANNCWALERQNPFKGGFITSEDRYYIRHIASGKYLAADLTLVKRDLAESFEFKSVDEAGNIGFGELCELVGAGVVSLDCSHKGDVATTQLFQKVARDLPPGTVLRQPLLGHSSHSCVENLKFEIVYVEPKVANCVVECAMFARPLAQLRLALQNVSKLQDKDRVIGDIDRQLDSEYLNMGTREMVDRAKVASDMQLPVELLRVYILVEQCKASLSEVTQKLPIFQNIWQVVVAIQYFERVFLAMFSRRSTMRSLIEAKPRLVAEILEYGLKTNMIKDSMQMYWGEIVMKPGTVEGKIVFDFNLLLFADRLVEKGRPKPKILDMFKANKQISVEFFPDATVRVLSETTPISDTMSKDRYVLLNAFLSLAADSCSSSVSRTGVISRSGLIADNAVRALRATSGFHYINQPLMKFITNVNLPEECGHEPLSEVIGKRMIAIDRIAGSQSDEERRSSWFFYPKPESPIAELVKEEVYYWLSTNHAEEESAYNWYMHVVVHVRFIEQLINYEAVSDIFVVSMVAAVSGLARWMLGISIPGFSERFPNLSRAESRVEIQTQQFMEAFLELVDTFQKWKIAKVLRALKAQGKTAVSPQDLTALIRQLDTRSIVDSFRAKFSPGDVSAPSKGDSLLAATTDCSPLLASLSQLLTNRYANIDNTLLAIFKRTPFHCRGRPSLILTLIDNEIDMSVRLTNYVNDLCDEGASQQFSALLEEIRQWEVSLLELERKECASVAGFPEVIQAMDNLAAFVKSIANNSEANANFKAFLQNANFKSDLEIMWERCVLVGSEFSEHPLNIHFRTLTLELTLYYIRNNFANRKEFLSIFPVQAFYPDYPQYIQLLTELGLLDLTGNNAARLSTIIYNTMLRTGSRRPILALKELMSNRKFASKVVFTVMENFTKEEKTTLSNSEWEVLLLFGLYINSAEKTKWFAPILSKFYRTDSVLPAIVALVILSDSQRDSMFQSALVTLRDYLTRITSDSKGELEQILKTISSRQSHTRNEEKSPDEMLLFIDLFLWTNYEAFFTLLLSKPGPELVISVAEKLCCLFLLIFPDSSVSKQSTSLRTLIYSFYSSISFQSLSEAHQALVNQVMQSFINYEVAAAPDVSVPPPQQLFQVVDFADRQPPLMLKLFDDEREKYVDPFFPNKETVALVKITDETFTDVKKWFINSSAESDYLTACNRAIDLLPTNSDQEQMKIYKIAIQTLLDFALHREDEDMIAHALDSVTRIVQKVPDVREHFLVLLQTRRYYTQVLGLFERLVQARKSLAQKISADNESEQQIYLKSDYGKKTIVITAFLALFERCCDGCNTPFQEFLRDQCQGAQNSINVISLTAGLLIDAMREKIADCPEEAVIVERGCLMLIEALSGPSADNQNILWKYPNFLVSVNEIISRAVNYYGEEKQMKAIFIVTLRLILAMLEGKEQNQEAITAVLYKDYSDKYIELAKNEAGKFDEATLMAMSSGTYTEKQKADFDFAVLCLLVCFNILPESSLAEFKIFPLTKFVASVEVEHTETGGEPKIRFISFSVPFECLHLTSETAIALLFEINRESRQVKLDDFTDKAEICKVEMLHQQSLSKHTLLKAVTKWWKYSWYCSFTLVLIINIILLMAVTHKDEDRFFIDKYWFVLLIPLGIAQVGLSLLGTFSFYIEYFYVLKTPLKKEIECAEIEKLPSSFSPGSLKAYLSVMKEANPWAYDTYEVMKATVRVLYSLGACAALVFPFVYPMLLLQIINLNDSVVNILKSVTHRGSQLVLTFLFAMICIYLFTITSYFFLPEYFDPLGGLYCDTLADCFLTTMNLGMRSGGGMGDALGPASESDFILRLVFDLLFFISITTILMAIVFGLIVDTFSELRDEKNEIEYDINNVCLICGKTRSVIELKGEGWEKHTLFIHNPFAYLYFLIHIQQTNTNDCSGIEKVVKEKLAIKDISFYPTTSTELGFDLSSDD